MSTDVGVQVSSLAPASEQSPLCSGAFYFTGNRKHHPLRSLAPPFQIEPVLCTGLRFGFLCPKLKNMLLLFEQASYRLLRLFMPVAKSQSALIPLLLLPDPDPLSLGSGFVFYGKVRFVPALSISQGIENVIRPLPCSSFQTVPTTLGPGFYF